MKTMLFMFFCPLALVYGQSVTMINELNEPIELYVDGARCGSSCSVSEGGHNLEARYSEGSTAAEYFTRQIVPLLLSTWQLQNDMNGRYDARDIRHCCSSSKGHSNR